MSISVGIGLAFVAMLCFGLGDFFIQRSTRKVGDLETLLVITLFGTLVLLPFVYGNIPKLFLDGAQSIVVLLSSGLFLTAAAICNLEGLKRGKLSVLEPLMPLEIVAASVFAFVVLGDRITFTQGILILALLVGISLLSFRETRISTRLLLEKGTIIFVLGMMLMGVADFFLGWGSRLTDPLMANFVIDLVMAIISFSILIARHKGKRIFKDFTTNRGLLLITSITDNVGWIAYAFVMTLIPIAVATGLSESSVVVAVILGLAVNREKLQFHQKIGLVVAIFTALILAAVTV